MEEAADILIQNENENTFNMDTDQKNMYEFNQNFELPEPNNQSLFEHLDVI